MPSPIQALIFDLDGTLLNSLDDLADCANTVLAEQGFAAHPVDAYRFFVGNGVEHLMRRAAPDNTPEPVLARLVQAMREEYGQHWARKSKVYDGIQPMLRTIAARPLPMAVLSNKPHELTEITVRHFFPDIPFARIQGSPRGGRAKPDPTLALAIAAHLGAEPEHTLFIGDSCTDMLTATAAGMIPTGVLWGFRPESELLAHGAKILLEQPETLFGHI